MIRTKRARTRMPHKAAELVILRANEQLAGIVADLRDAGAAKAADYVARARKSVQGAGRHATRVLRDGGAA